jgi:hypothetical protein
MGQYGRVFYVYAGREKMKRSLLVLIAVASLSILLGGCSNFSMNDPEGFAPLKRKGGGPYRAVSPEGMVFRVRTVKPEPEKELEFWKETLYHQLEKEGYEQVGDAKQFDTKNSAGVLYLWGLRHAGTDYLYMTAIVEAGKKLLVAESAAEAPVFLKYRDAIEKSLASISIKRQTKGNN